VTPLAEGTVEGFRKKGRGPEKKVQSLKGRKEGRSGGLPCLKKYRNTLNKMAG